MHLSCRLALDLALCRDGYPVVVPPDSRLHRFRCLLPLLQLLRVQLASGDPPLPRLQHHSCTRGHLLGRASQQLPLCFLGPGQSDARHPPSRRPLQDIDRFLGAHRLEDVLQSPLLQPCLNFRRYLHSGVEGPDIGQGTGRILVQLR